MTLLGVVADVHGNLPALRTVLEDMAPFGVDQVVCAGDVANGAPFANETFALVHERRWPVVRGNGEYYLTDFGTPRAPAAWNDRQNASLITWFAESAARWRGVVAAWPDALSLRYPDAPPLLVVHGVPGNPWDGIRRLATDEEVAERLAGVEEETVVVAHTHTPTDRRVGRWRVLNPARPGSHSTASTRRPTCCSRAPPTAGGRRCGGCRSTRRRRWPPTRRRE